jgi:hypothetical protein
MLGRWTSTVARLASSPLVRTAVLTLYYLGMLGGLLYLYGRGDFATPPFIYQRF